MNLIIGSGSQVGKILLKKIGGVGLDHQDYNLKGVPTSLPEAQIVYILASKTKFRDCELDEDAWAVNVDGPIKIGHRYRNSFVVFVSSEAAEWSGRTAYGDQKRHAELGLLSVVPYENLAIVRPKKLTPERIEPFCEFLKEVGENRRCGIHRF